MFRGTKKMLLMGLFLLVSVITFGVYMATEAFNSLVVPPEPVRALRVELVKDEGYQIEVLGYQVEVDFKPLVNKIQDAVPEWVPSSGEVEAFKAQTMTAVEKGQDEVVAWWSKVKEMAKEKIADNSQ
ncbi:MAG: hypothetical protein ACYDG6_09330 [Thermincolia bacterium]